MGQRKLPAFQFYPGDWLKDPGVRALSLEARGLWIDLLCVMHESGRRGFLELNGEPPSAEQIIRMTASGVSKKKLKSLLEELEKAGVFSRDDNGVIYCRRMVRDEKERGQGRERVRKHRAGRVGSNGSSNGEVTEMKRESFTPSSSSSSTSLPPNPRGGNGNGRGVRASPCVSTALKRAYSAGLKERIANETRGSGNPRGILLEDFLRREGFLA